VLSTGRERNIIPRRAAVNLAEKELASIKEVFG
jgi:hypothetical protein